MMMKKFLLGLSIVLGSMNMKAQDTFSILAFDSVTREVGAAGASCVDLFNFSGFSNDFICELFPDTGAIATQAAYISTNQYNARGRMRAGDDPAQLLLWLQQNDVGVIQAPNASYRQYGVINMNTGSPASAAFTGSNCTNYKNHIVGPNYTIHGNILLGQQVLDSMEARFLRAEGDLACKLMAAMQGAKMVGADTRCAGNNSSSLFAFLKVMQPTDTFGRPSLLVSLKTAMGDSIEPVDSLQVLFDAVRSCTVSTVGVKEFGFEHIEVFPNPSSGIITIDRGNIHESTRVLVKDVSGKTIHDAVFKDQVRISVKDWKKGVYFFELRDSKGSIVKKVLVE